MIEPGPHAGANQGLNLDDGRASTERTPETPCHRVLHVASIISATLHLQPTVAKSLAEAWWEHVQETKRYWDQAAEMSLKEAIRCGADFAGPELSSIQELAAAEQRGLVLATIHMGDYLSALFAVARALDNRPLSVVRRRQVSERDAKVFAKLEQLGIDVEVVVTDDRAAVLRLARRLRRGGAAIMFYDLHDGFGQTRAVDFLGLRVRWVEGPIRLAAACNALVVPFAAATDAQNRKKLLPADAAVAFNEPNVSEAERTAVLRSLADFASTTVRRHPDQWLHWAQLPRMAVPIEP